MSNNMKNAQATSVLSKNLQSRVDAPVDAIARLECLTMWGTTTGRVSGSHTHQGNTPR